MKPRRSRRAVLSATQTLVSHDRPGIVPQVGDYVEIPRSRMGEREVYKGKVCRRTFRHVLGYVYVRIVLAEVEEKDWSNQSC